MWGYPGMKVGQQGKPFASQIRVAGAVGSTLHLIPSCHFLVASPRQGILPTELQFPHWKVGILTLFTTHLHHAQNLHFMA